MPFIVIIIVIIIDVYVPRTSHHVRVTPTGRKVKIRLTHSSGEVAPGVATLGKGEGPARVAFWELTPITD